MRSLKKGFCKVSVSFVLLSVLILLRFRASEVHQDLKMINAHEVISIWPIFNDSLNLLLSALQYVQHHSSPSTSEYNYEII